MKEKSDPNKMPKSKEENTSPDLPGYPEYPASEDIFNKDKEETEIDPENITQLKKSSPKEKKGAANEKDFEDDFVGDDLDVPGSMDDEDIELFELEDEENGYFSLGGDDHNDLEEDAGEDLGF